MFDLVAPSSRKITTEGIKYTGSKLKIIPYILQLMSEVEPITSVLDGFSGTTRVSQAFAQCGYHTTSNDISVWSEVFATCYLKAPALPKLYGELIDHLNNLKGFDGWFTEHYGADTAIQKRPFQRKNTQKLDSIRDEIERLQVSWEIKCVLLTSLIHALDSVDNTLGHFAAYLADWSPRSYKDLRLKVPNKFPIISENTVLRDDIFRVVQHRDFDLTYFDPPYGSNNQKMPPSRVRYASYYHMWTSVILNDKPELFGKANRREDSRDRVSGSVFEEFRKNDTGASIALEALEQLLKSTRSRYIVLSYSSGGRASRHELTDIIEATGHLRRAIRVDHAKNVMAHMRTTNDWVTDENKHQEYLFLMEK